MARHKTDFSVLSNLSNKQATQGHWGTTTWLTSADVNGTPGKQFQNTVSVDQVATRHRGVETRFPSLEPSGKAEGGGYGPGLSLSWSESGNPIAGETSPIACSEPRKFRSKNENTCYQNNAASSTPCDRMLDRCMQTCRSPTAKKSTSISNRFATSKFV